ncbi:hypothetical protein [Flavobacterium sp. 11]|uniref:hypothetical protein n=1 Tax=Flavobacterium sp. 11 TaxID=357523 RepID=UPI000C187EB2|nr:hypothetical protein [Flavobacterium sp. 11]
MFPDKLLINKSKDLVSHYFTLVFKKLQFILIIVGRFLKILFRKSKEIELLYLNYSTEYIFDNSLIIINYRFRNGLWYRFGKHKTLEKEIKIFNLKNFDTEFDLVVYGFFQRKVFKLKFEPQLTINTQRFKTSLSNLSLEIVEKTIPALIQPNLFSNIRKPSLVASKIKVTNKPIIINNNTYNQNEFI